MRAGRSTTGEPLGLAAGSATAGAERGTRCSAPAFMRPAGLARAAASIWSVWTLRAAASNVRAPPGMSGRPWDSLRTGEGRLAHLPGWAAFRAAVAAMSAGAGGRARTLPVDEGFRLRLECSVRHGLGPLAPAGAVATAGRSDPTRQARGHA